MKPAHASAWLATDSTWTAGLSVWETMRVGFQNTVLSAAVKATGHMKVPRLA